jgi:hypothetical protein
MWHPGICMGGKVQKSTAGLVDERSSAAIAASTESQTMHHAVVYVHLDQGVTGSSWSLVVIHISL